MNIKSAWSYLNKELLALLSFLVVSTLISIVYMTHTLVTLHDFTKTGSQATGTAFVLQDLLINMQDIESSVRGYVLSDNSALLGPYQKAKTQIPPDLRILNNENSLVITDTEVARITDLVNKKIAFMDEVVALRQSDGFEAARARISSGEGEEVMQELRQEITNISSFGLQNIGPTQQRAQASINRALWVAATLAVLVLATCAAVIWYFQRAILHERALESTKNEFLSLASHQLRTPATNVKQYLGLLLDGFMGDISPEQKHALEVAYRNNEVEINIMNDLLDVAKLDLNRIQLHKEITNLIKVARQVIKDKTKIAREHRHTITLIGPKQVMASVDETYIKGVMENLLDNAIKYSRDSTHITITIFRQQDNVLIEVTDEGLGIKKRDVGKLFNKFSRLDNEFSANSEGSGLGLYWVKQVVGLHDGSIDVSSREGKGSTFTVKLPVR